MASLRSPPLPCWLLLILFFLLPASAAPATKSLPLIDPSLVRKGFHPASSPPSAAPVQYETKYFTQTLDHFSFLPQGYATFQQRYLVNDEHWGGAAARAPIFVYTGNEGDVEMFARNTGFVFEQAPNFKALVVFVEHRYYGESIPFGGRDVAYKNASTLGYLTTTQALADFATLIIDLKKNLSAESSPVIAFGGSYGGMLAAWLRLKYPHVVMGALSSSSPLLQFDGMVSPYTFNDIITKDYKSESQSCFESIRNSWDVIEKIVSQPDGLQKLREGLKICKVDGWDDAVYQWINEALVYAAMTDYPTPANFLRPLPAYPVREMCKAIDDPKTGNDTLAKFYGAMNVYYNHTGTAKCFDPTNSPLNLGTEAWGWQSCVELILTTGGSGNDSIFPPVPYNYTELEVYCQESYHVKPRPHWITTEFGGHDISKVLQRFGSNIIFFNGLRDPWSGGGILKSISDSIIAIVAPEGAHHVDLRFSTDEDPDWLRRVRGNEVQILETWLRLYYRDMARRH